jgi:hypothetical protein
MKSAKDQTFSQWFNPMAQASISQSIKNTTLKTHFRGLSMVCEGEREHQSTHIL